MPLEIGLILLTLASTVVGTLLDPKRWVKVGIITIASVASFLTIVKAYNDNQDKAFIKRALASELATSRPSRQFKSVFDRSLTQIAKSHGLYVDTSKTKDQGTLYLFHRSGSGTPAAAVTFSPDDMGDVFVKYAEGKPLNGILEHAMFQPPNTDTENGMQSFLDELALVGNIVLDDELQWMTPETNIQSTTNVQEHSVQVSAMDGQNTATVQLQPSVVNRLQKMPFSEAELQAYHSFQKQLRR